MPEPVQERRRSNRLVLDVGLIVRGESFEENTFTVSVSQHGALLLLSTTVTKGQTLFLINPETKNEIECQVVRFGASHGGLHLVGVEFSQPSREFWPW